MIETIETYLHKTIKCGDDVVSIVSIFLLTIKNTENGLMTDWGLII